MNIIKATKKEIFIIETDNEEFSGMFTRYSKDCWYQEMGDSDELLYDCKELEDKFQEFIKKDEN